MRFCNMTLMHHYEKDDFVHYAMLKRGNKHSIHVVLCLFRSLTPKQQIRNQACP